MKKNLFITVMLIAVMALSVLSFAACAPIESSEKDSELTPPTSEPPAAEMVTVSFWDGTEELKVETIEKGATVAEWTPEKVGYSFMGWFAEASLAQAFDFTAPVNEDIDVFAAWRSNDYVEDTAAWYFIGAGAGDMSASNWGHSTEGLFMVKDDTITDANVYTITVLMYAGDKFQITHSDSWDYQQGIGHMVGFEYAAGVNPYAPASGEMTAADKKYGEVRDCCLILSKLRKVILILFCGREIPLADIFLEVNYYEKFIKETLMSYLGRRNGYKHGCLWR